MKTRRILKETGLTIKEVEIYSNKANLISDENLDSDSVILVSKTRALNLCERKFKQFLFNNKHLMFKPNETGISEDYLGELVSNFIVEESDTFELEYNEVKLSLREFLSNTDLDRLF
jgi:hypothetical protein